MPAAGAARPSPQRLLFRSCPRPVLAYRQGTDRSRVVPGSANYRHGRGEIDLIARDGEVLAFVEVKSRSSESWARPAQAVGRPKQRMLSDTALAYLNELGRPQVAFRFDIVEVLFAGAEVREVRHIPNAFPLAEGRMYR